MSVTRGSIHQRSRRSARTSTIACAAATLVVAAACKRQNAAPPGPADIDVPAIARRFLCDTTQQTAMPQVVSNQGCAVVRSFEHAPAFNRWPAAGAEVWVGRAWCVSAPDEDARFFVIRVERRAASALALSLSGITAAQALPSVLSVANNAVNVGFRRPWDALMLALESGAPTAVNPGEMTDPRQPTGNESYVALTAASSRGSVVGGSDATRTFVRMEPQGPAMLVAQPSALGGCVGRLWRLP